MRICIQSILLFLLLSQSNSPGQTRILHESFDAETALGVVGQAKCFDGYFTEHKLPPESFTEPENGFTIEAWIAPQEFALDTAAIIDREKNFESGYLLGIDHYGHLVGAASINGEWKRCVSQTTLPLLQWSQVVMALSPENGIQLWINGVKVGALNSSGRLSFCRTQHISIGKTQTPTQPCNTERKTSQAIKIQNRFDGLIDELSVFEGVLTTTSIQARYKAVTIKNPQPLAYRKMPSGDGGTGPFGAYYCQLKYSPAWDKLWQGSDYPDIIVRFPDNPVRFVFWRGTSYVPAVVSDNGIWMTDQSLECWGPGECFEAMGDKQTRYSHVRIIENSPARCVIHWRYALASIQHAILAEDETGRGDWADEYWTIYPDAVASRKQVLWSKHYDKDLASFQFQETIFLNQPGTKPQDNVNDDAITFCDMDGHKASYSWKIAIPKKFDEPAFQPIQLVNFKSEHKPFSIFHPKRITRPFSFGAMPGYSTFPCWNHWPVQQSSSDGRNAVAADKPSHSSLTESNGSIQIVEKGIDGSYLAASLIGMTTKPIDSLLPLARSWNFPPEFKIVSDEFQYLGYDKYQRAYLLIAENPKARQLEIQIDSSEASPVQNIALIIDNIDLSHARVIIRDAILKRNADYTTGMIGSPDRDKTIVFIKVQSSHPLTIKICKL
jgi:hypothetical protein